MARYVALLRGINVGGRNKIAMTALRETFESAGLESVRTYIQSGNVLFETKARGGSLESEIEGFLEKRLKIPLVVVVRSHTQIRKIVTDAPKGFGTQPGKYHSDVVFLKAPLTAEQALRAVELRDGVDQAWPGAGVLYVARLSARLSQSRINRFASTPTYKQVTIRNWNTTTKLLALLDAE